MPIATSSSRTSTRGRRVRTTYRASQNERTSTRGSLTGTGSDRGLTLVEIVIAITLMGVVLVAVLNAVTTGINASVTSRAAARIETTVVNVADRINRAPTLCDYGVYAEAAVLSEGWEPSAADVAAQHYIVGSDPGQLGSWVDGACPAGHVNPPDLLVQRVSVTLHHPDSNMSRTVEVLKSDV